MTEQAYDLTVSRVLKAPRTAVWKAWTVPEHIDKWFSPAPFRTIVKQLDLRPGGAFETVIRAEDGTEFGGEGCFLEVIEQQRIVFTDALSGGWRPAEQPFFTAIITMEDHPEGTLYTATALHKNAEDRQKHADMGFITGWGTCIEQLGELAVQLA